MEGKFIDWVKSEKTKQTCFKIGRIIGNVMLYVFIVLGLFCVLVALVSKKDADGTATVFGYQMRVVETGSMDYNQEFADTVGYDNVKIGKLPAGTMVFIKVLPDRPEDVASFYGDLEKGDVITFKYSDVGKQVTVTHRITNILYRPTDGGYTITLKGDNGPVSDNSVADEQVIDTLNQSSLNYVIGKVEGSSLVLGWLVTTLQKPLGLILIIMLPCALIIVWEVVKIINMFGADKKKKQQEQEAYNAEIQQKQQDEIENLKKKLAMLENKEDESYHIDTKE